MNTKLKTKVEFLPENRDPIISFITPNGETLTGQVIGFEVDKEQIGVSEEGWEQYKISKRYVTLKFEVE